MAQKNPWSCFFLLTGFWAVGSLCAQDGFLSLSCGGKSNYTDKHGLSWTPDNDYTDTGNATTINLHIDTKRNSSIPARYFLGSSQRRCFELSPNNVSSVVLVRAEFVYANYDGFADPPAFSVSLGTAVVAAVDLAENDPSVEEFVWRFGEEVVSFCLLGHRRRGSPVISSLEVRPLPERAYGTGMEDFPSKLLRKSHRINCGYTSGMLRYPYDPYDRIWDSDKYFSPSHISTGFKAKTGFKRSSRVKEKPPLGIFETARVLARTEDLTYKLPLKKLGDYYVILYFAGILLVNPSFNIIINGDTFLSNFTVKSSQARALYFTTMRVRMLNITLKSTNFYPQVNAIEVYEIIDIPSQASSTTVSALQVIQQSTGSDLGWKDDPCSPTLWDHIGCEGSLVTSLKLGGIGLRSIIPTFGDLLNLKELDLHNTSLTGVIQNLGSLQKLEKLNLSFNSLTSFGSELENLISLRVLDLQNNTLKETVPDSLGELENLHFLNLENNKLQGALPHSLNKDSLEIRTLGNLCLSFSGTPCNDVSSNPSSIETPQVTILTRKKPHNTSPGFYHLVVMIALIAGALLAFLCVSLSIFFYIRKKKKISNKASFTERLAIDMRNWNAEKVFTYKEIKSATNNFKEVIGRGSFGSVHFGKLKDGKLVAVKLRSDKSQLGADSFVNEVCLLSRIRHQNLVSMEGFCHESKHQILVYEYLPGGSLADHLYGTKSRKVSLSWVRRLKIAVDAAKGLDYLHNGTQPRIIHRDVKCSNILLDVEMNAKVCDFGLSKQVTQPDASHVTTVVKGTAGYLDPEYYTTQQLTEKSDVYSFGVVLLELICGREPLTHRGNPDTFNLVLWAKPYLQAGAFEIVDDSLKGSFDAESMRKAALIAVRSVERDASQRPKITHVLAQLKEAYTIQLSYLASRDM